MVYRQAVLKKAFEGELTKEWREQQTDLPTAEELLEQIKEERQKHYEQQLENWKQELKAWEENGKEAKKPTKPKKLIPYPTINQLGELPILNLGELVFQISRKLMPQEAPNLPFIGMDCLNKNALKPHFTYTFKEFKSAGNWFNENHVLYGRLRPYLNKVYQAEYEGVASGEFIILETIDSIYSNYLKLIIHQQDFVRWSNNQSSGDKPRVKFDQIALYQIKVPSKIEQLQIVQEIESRLSVCDNVGESITESLEKAKALRQSILKKAFEGTLLSVEEIVACKAAKDYEPASVLLEKIKAEKKK
jgi:type I restriction enzyme S subunit